MHERVRVRVRACVCMRNELVHVRLQVSCCAPPRLPVCVIFSLRLFPAAAIFGNFQLSRLAGLGYGFGFWVVFTIIVSLTPTLTVI